MFVVVIKETEMLIDKFGQDCSWSGYPPVMTEVTVKVTGPEEKVKQAILQWLADASCRGILELWALPKEGRAGGVFRN